MHVAIIPDGNRRWAKQRALQLIAGHQAGSQAWQAILESSDIAEISWLTFWGASIDNLTKRTAAEIENLLALFDIEFARLVQDPRIHEKRMRVRVLGEWASYLWPSTQQNIANITAATVNYDQQNVTLLIAYDGLKAMVDTIQSVAMWWSQHSDQHVTVEIIQQHMVTGVLPPVDLIIRTGGEPHMSGGFLMWEVANAQLIFCDKLWPDVQPAHIALAVEEYHRRTRRFGT